MRHDKNVNDKGSSTQKLAIHMKTTEPNLDQSKRYIIRHVNENRSMQSLKRNLKTTRPKLHYHNDSNQHKHHMNESSRNLESKTNCSSITRGKGEAACSGSDLLECNFRSPPKAGVYGSTHCSVWFKGDLSFFTMAFILVLFGVFFCFWFFVSFLFQFMEIY